MSKYLKHLKHLRVSTWVLAAASALGLQAQYAPAPTEYSVTQINGMMGQPTTMQIYRDGNNVVMDHPDNHLRSLYDLQTHTNQDWDTQHPENGCSNGTFSGDWGDPFQSSDLDSLLKSSTAPPASATVNGVVTKVFEATDPKSKMKVKVWREPKYGMIIRADLTPPGGAATTIIETKQFSFGKPPAALFALPPSCGKAPPPPPTAPERFATETGDNGANFDDATMPPGSPNSCTMLMRFVKAGSMQPISNFQVALDLSFDPNNAPHYVMGGSSSGRTVFSGGHLKEYTDQIRNGVLRIDNAPAVFELEMTFAGGNNGASSAMLYRKCAGPQTVLLYVQKNPDKVSEGADWIWVKSGKFATVQAH